jgi:hypothetical protein
MYKEEEMLYVAVIQQVWKEPETGGAIDSYLVDGQELNMLYMIIEWLHDNVACKEELGNTIPYHEIIGVVKTGFSKDDDPVTVKMQLFKDAVTAMHTDSRYEEDPNFYGCKPWPISMRWTKTHRITTIIQESKEVCNEDGGVQGTGCSCHDETVKGRFPESEGCDCRRSGECCDD